MTSRVILHNSSKTRTKLKILQHNRLNANIFVSVKHQNFQSKQKLHQYFKGPIKISGTEIFRDGRQLKAQNFFTPSRIIQKT